jgi:hypothetical protein
MDDLDRFYRLRLHDEFVESYALAYRKAKLSERLTLRRRLLTEWRSQEILEKVHKLSVRPGGS